jgi:hypothetical protein
MDSLALLALSCAFNIQTAVFLPPAAAVVPDLRAQAAMKPVVFGYVKNARAQKVFLRLQDSHFTALETQQNYSVATHTDICKLLDPLYCVATAKCEPAIV